jgi:hypothetical protein
VVEPVAERLPLWYARGAVLGLLAIPWMQLMARGTQLLAGLRSGGREPRMLHSPLRRMWRGLRLTLMRGLGAQRVPDSVCQPFDLLFTGRLADRAAREAYRRGCHQPELTRFIVQNVRMLPGDLAIDAGADIGWCALVLDRLCVPGADVIAFESDRERYRLLLYNMHRNHAAYVTPVNGAIAAAPRGLGGRQVRFLKIDMSGYDYFKLNSAITLLQRCPYVSLQFSARHLRAADVDPARVISALSGFRVRRWVDGSLLPVGLPELSDSNRLYDLLLTRRGGG